MAPAHDPDPVRVDVGHILLHVVDGGEDVVYLISPIIDRIVVFGSIAGAPPVLGCDHYVSALSRLFDEGKIGLIPVPMHATMYPYEGSVATRPPLLQGLEDIGGDFESIYSALVSDFLRIDRKSTRLNSSNVAISYAVF